MTTVVAELQGIAHEAIPHLTWKISRYLSVARQLSCLADAEC